MNLEIEVTIWFAFAGICYRLREFEIWGRGNNWWMNRRNYLKNKTFHKLTFNFFLDSYHFFGNLTRVSLAIRFIFIDYELGIAAFSAWYLGTLITKTAIEEISKGDLRS